MLFIPEKGKQRVGGGPLLLDVALAGKCPCKHVRLPALSRTKTGIRSEIPVTYEACSISQRSGQDTAISRRSAIPICPGSLQSAAAHTHIHRCNVNAIHTVNFLSSSHSRNSRSGCSGDYASEQFWIIYPFTYYVNSSLYLFQKMVFCPVTLPF